jgi:hypothetical protein
VMNWLLLFVPVAVGLEFLAPERHLLVFVASSLAILPLAGWMGRATEQLAERWARGSAGFSMPRSAMPPNSSSHSRVAGGAPRCGEGVDRRVHRREHPAGARRRDVGGRVAPSRATLQSGRGAFAGNDAHARGDRVDPPRCLSGRSGRDSRGPRSPERLDFRCAAARLSAFPRVLTSHSLRALRGLSPSRGRERAQP